MGTEFKKQGLGTSCAFDKLLRQLFGEKVAEDAIKKLPDIVEALLRDDNYIELIGHFNLYRFIAGSKGQTTANKNVQQEYGSFA